MRDKLVAKRYAQAYIDFASPKIGLERCVEEMKSLKWVIRDNRELDAFFRAPEIPRSEKARILDKALSKHYSEELLTFIKYLLECGRILALKDIAEYIRLEYSHAESTDVVLRTTFPLELDLISAIKNRLETFLKKKTNLYLELDPDLLGGVQLVVGNTIIDGSVRNRLNALRKKLLQTQVV